MHSDRLLLAANLASNPFKLPTLSYKHSHKAARVRRRDPEEALYLRIIVDATLPSAPIADRGRVASALPVARALVLGMADCHTPTQTKRFRYSPERRRERRAAMRFACAPP